MPCGCAKRGQMPGVPAGATYEVTLPNGTVETNFGSALAAQSRAKTTRGTFRVVLPTDEEMAPA